MYDKKYRVTSIVKTEKHNIIYEMDKYNPVHENLLNKICYPAYLKVGERGWLLYDTEEFFNPMHRLHTSVIKHVKYNNDKIVIETENTLYVLKLVE